MEYSLSQASKYLNKSGLESVTYLTAEPDKSVKVMGRMTDVLGRRLLEKIPPKVFENLGGLASEFVMPKLAEELKLTGIEEFQKVIDIINRADKFHSTSLQLVFTEGTVAGGVGSVAGLAGPGASLLVAITEMPLSYLLLLRRLLEAQASFFVTPNLQNANRAFEMASAVTVEAKLAAWSNNNESMLSAVIARKLSTKQASKFAGFTAHRVAPLLQNVTVRSVTGELSDTGTEQVTSSLLQSGLRSYFVKHPQLMASIFPIIGALASGLMGVMSARRSLLTNYHLSRIEYIENVRRILGIQPLLT